MKIIIIFTIIAILIIAGMVLIVSNLGITSQNQSPISENYTYEIQGDAGGAGSHTKTDLLLKRINNDNPSDIHIVDLTKDLHYTDHIMFWDWQIHTFENYVFVSWITSERSWSDVFLAVSDDYGKTFDVKNISQSKEYVHQYKIDYSEDTIYFVWQHQFITEENDHINQITFTKSDNFGASFGQQRLLSTFDKSSYEFDLEAFDDNVFVAWRQDLSSPDEKNVWFATSTNRGEYFERETKLLGARVDVESFNGILHLTWVSVEDVDQVWYAYSEDLGKTLHSRIIFDADWNLSPYAVRPIPVITINDEIFIEWEMNNKEGEKTTYQVRIGSDSEKTVSGAYELDEALCIGGRGYIKNDECERIGKYDIQTGIPIVENKTQCDLLNGTWYAEQDKCDSKYAPTEYRLQFGNSFLGYDIPQICTYDIMKHLAKYSNLLDEGFVGEYGIEDIGLPDSVTQEKFDECADFIFKQRTKLLENTYDKTTLEEVLESCTNDSPKERMANVLRYTNETHVFLNLECEWKKIGKYLGE